MYDLVTFGEMLLRLGAPNFERIEQADHFNVVVTGAEMNSCVVASRFGLKTAHVTRLPRNPLGRMIENKTREHGIDTSHFVWTDEGRVGLFFLETGAMPRTSAVLYDRANSEMSKIQPGDVDWDTLFRQTRFFHLCGTAPALSASAAETVRTAMSQARNHGAEVSLDLNYRAKLWSLEDARRTFVSLMPFCNILILGDGDLNRMFQIQTTDYRKGAQLLREKFNLDVVVVTLREDITVWRNNWSAIACSRDAIYDDVTYQMDIVDRVGGGDAFTGAFLYAYLAYNKDVKKAIQYGNAACALKHTIPGDLNWVTREEVEELIRRGPGGGTNLRINR